MNTRSAELPYILGLDLGAESVGWAILECIDDEPVGITATGAHTFDAGVEGDFETGRDKSRAKARRDARQMRRQHWRRAWRRQKLLRILRKHGLFPNTPLETPEEIHKTLLELDSTLRSKNGINGDRVSAQLLPYRLRAKALNQKLEPYELGRALYHLAQRRGFLSSRKTDKNDEKNGEVKQGINELQAAMDAVGAPTLGAYFASLDPQAAGQRIRSRWTSRRMYVEEFEAIWNAQRPHHASLNDEIKAEISDAIFSQRPLKSQKHLIGKCELVKGHRCAPIALRVAQRFRLLQKVNDLLICMPDGSQRPLTREERQQLIDALDTQGELKFTTIRGKKLLNLPRGTTFNLEEGGETKMPGNRTDARLATIFGNRWETLSEEERNQVVEDVLSFENNNALMKRAQKAWGLDTNAAQALASLSLEDGYARHCRRALEVFVQRFKDGVSYATIRKEEFPESHGTVEPVDLLPPVLEAIADLRNPAVCRALTELRKVTNAIIRRYGKPQKIRIELARDLKRPRKQRVEASNRNRQNQKQRDDAYERILKAMPGYRPRNPDIEKVRLADECNWQCPYTGRPIDMRSLIGPEPQFDVEHIWPMSRSLDNTFLNKTLCYHEENRVRKQNRTPFEAYSATTDRWEEILGRVAKFKGDATREKLRRFQAEEIPEGFTDRQLQDTRYASRLAADYLGLLYGGRIDAEGTQRIQVSTGGVTNHLRNEWMLNSILNDGGAKSRDDHRHHAVDAIAIGLAGPKTVKLLADAAQKATKQGHRLFASIPYPWDSFLEQAHQSIRRINVSKRTSRKVNGPLHEETLYSKTHKAHGNHGQTSEYRHVRKPLAAMTTGEIESIVDPTIRRLVKEKLGEIGGKDGKAFASSEHFPVLKTRDGESIPIRKARFRKPMNAICIGEGPRKRYVAPGSNHHMAIVTQLDKEGRECKWSGHLVNRFEAVQRVRQGIPVVQRDWTEGQHLKFSLASGDMFMLSDETDPETVYIVRSVSKGRIEFVTTREARDKKTIKKAGDWKCKSPDKLREAGCRKVKTTYLGEVIPAND